MDRPLWLHISALSPDEYNTYPLALEDIASIGQGGDEDWESRSVSVLVAKGWIRGRYRDQVDGEVVDKILRYFYPGLSPTDVLSAGQFFAALRLISHAQRGHALDKNLVFIQARPSDENGGRVSPHKTKSLRNLRSMPPPIQPEPPQPSRFARDSPSSDSDGQQPASAQSVSPVRADSVIPKSAPPIPSTLSPFGRRLSTPGDTTPNHTSGTVNEENGKKRRLDDDRAASGGRRPNTNPFSGPGNSNLRQTSRSKNQKTNTGSHSRLTFGSRVTRITPCPISFELKVEEWTCAGTRYSAGKNQFKFECDSRNRVSLFQIGNDPLLLMPEDFAEFEVAEPSEEVFFPAICFQVTEKFASSTAWRNFSGDDTGQRMFVKFDASDGLDKAHWRECVKRLAEFIHKSILTFGAFF
ncbi:hypothetical protein FRC12_010827 [Ceratobasidium sp. 428]|nr:hypothetical protein FRC12_010827 [Ceratobasidium sp. 428]